MHMRCLILSLFFVVSATKLGAQSFDHYVLSLSWSPSWCVTEGKERGSEQCSNSADFGWILHGLWPQNDTSWLSYCQSRHAPPSRSLTGSMKDIMDTSGLAWHQWKKHGSCSDLAAEVYFEMSRNAYESITRPSLFRRLTEPVTLRAEIVDTAFLKENPSLNDDMVRVTCKDGHVAEIRVCLNKDLSFRSCAPSMRADCDETVVMPHIP